MSDDNQRDAEFGKLQVRWLTVKPTPYNDHLYRAAAKNSAWRFSVTFSRMTSSEHPWQSELAWGFTWTSQAALAGGVWTLIARAIIERDTFWIVAGWGESSHRWVLAVLALLNRRYAVHADTPPLRSGRSSFFELCRALYLRWILGTAEAVLGAGCLACRNLRALGAPDEKVYDFPYLVNLDRFRPPDSPCVGEDSVTFLSVGRLLLPSKGYDLAVRALGTIKDGNCGRFRFLIAGEGPQREQLEELSQRTGLASRTSFLGWVEPEDLPDLYQKATVFLHPARYEPYGVVVVEALATGVPVIGAHGVGAVAHRVKDGENGFIHQSGSLEDLTRKIKAFLGLPLEERQRMRHAAREEAERWPVQRGVRVLEDIIVRRGETEHSAL